MRYKNYGFKSEQEFKKTIHEAYNSGLSQKQIAEKIGCSRHTIIKLFKYLGIQSNKHALYLKCGFASERAMVKGFKTLYKQGSSQKEIANYFNVSLVSISKAFRKHNIKARTNSESIAILQKDVQLSEEEEQIIYGLLLGNGILKRKKYTATLEYSCTHEKAIKSLLTALRRLSPSYKFRRSMNRGWYQIHTLAYMCLAQMYDEWHNKQKELPKDFILTPENCYWWYVGDGNSTPEALKLVTGVSNPDLLLEKMPVKAEWYEAREKYLIVCINDIEERKKFIEFIGPCKHESYNYKWVIYNSKLETIADYRQQDRDHSN